MSAPDNILKQHEDLLHGVCRLALTYLESLNIHNLNTSVPSHLYAVVLCCRLVELAHTAEVLFQKGALAGIPIILRSMWEADIDMSNVINDPDYFKQMYLGFLIEKVRFLKAAKTASTQSAFFNPIVEICSIDQELKAVEGEISSLKANGIAILNIRDRAQKANRTDEYSCVYTNLCLASHNNIVELERSHIISSNSNHLRVAIFSQKREEYLSHINAVIGIVLKKIEELSTLFGDPPIKDNKHMLDFIRLQDTIKSEAKRALSEMASESPTQ